MCQATGYKLKSNKELPCQFQVFSKLIPMTSHDGGSDVANQNQIYPMYSVLMFNHDREGNINAIDVRLCRITGIFKSDGGDSFTQTSYGTKKLHIEYLIEVNGDNVEDLPEGVGEITQSKYMYGAWISESETQLVETNKYLYIKY